MTYKKFFGSLVCLIIMVILLVLLIKYVKINTIENNYYYIDTLEYKQKIENINKLKDTIDSLNNKIEYDKDKINNLDDSSTVKLFIELVKGE